MKNGELRRFSEFLIGLEANAKDTRMRARFIKFAQERLKEMEDFRIELINKYAEKDSLGEVIVNKGDDGAETCNITDMAGFLEEYNAMLEEEFRVDYMPERKDMLLAVSSMVLDIPDNVTFSGANAVEYDRWCEIVEGIDFKD